MTESPRDRFMALRYGVATALSFAGADLMSVHSRPFGYRRVDFSGANLRHATLHCWFNRCSLIGADFRSADLRGASFTGCDLTDADFRDADLRDVTFGPVKGTGDDWLTTISRARFEGADLRGVAFDRVVGTTPIAG